MPGGQRLEDRAHRPPELERPVERGRAGVGFALAQGAERGALLAGHRVP